jgi:hypothetical protein
MLTPDVAPQFVYRSKRSVYSEKDRFIDSLPKRQSVRLTARQKRVVFEAVKEYREQSKIMEAMENAAVSENPKMIKKRFVPSQPVEVSCKGKKKF